VKVIVREGLILAGFVLTMFAVNFWLILGFRLNEIELTLDQAGGLGLYLMRSFIIFYVSYAVIKIIIYLFRLRGENNDRSSESHTGRS